MIWKDSYIEIRTLEILPKAQKTQAFKAETQSTLKAFTSCRQLWQVFCLLLFWQYWQGQAVISFDSFYLVGPKRELFNIYRQQWHSIIFITFLHRSVV